VASTSKRAGVLLVGVRAWGVPEEEQEVAGTGDELVLPDPRLGLTVEHVEAVVPAYVDMGGMSSDSRYSTTIKAPPLSAGPPSAAGSKRRCESADPRLLR
jgi:hypothetical protein